MKFLLAIITIWAIFPTFLLAKTSSAKAKESPAAQTFLSKEKQTSGLFGITPWKRNEFRPSKEAFQAKYLTIDCEVYSQNTITGAVYVKDKDGNFFQYQKSISFKGDGKKETIQCIIDERSAFWQSYSNNESWNAQIASSIYEVGISLGLKNHKNFMLKYQT